MRVIGLLCIGFGLSVVPPIFISWWYGDGEFLDLIESLSAMVMFGLLLWFPVRGHQAGLRRKDGFLVVVLFWILLGCFGALPFLFALHISFIDALFESVSGLTTTGATVFSGLDQMPRSILFYRQELQWLGGMGLIVLAVAVLPMLGIGGMSLYRAETPGPMKEEKITPRLFKAAQILWVIYVALTLLCALAYWLAGMTPFDAFAHSLSTVSSGGFSTHDASLAYFDSALIESVAVVFMLLGAINFGVHYTVLHKRSLLYYFKDTEARVFLFFIAATVLVVSVALRLTNYNDSLLDAFRNAFFEVVSVVTSTGFGTVDFSVWPLFLPVLLITISFVGGCGGSTAGGMKVMRVMILLRLGYREIVRLVHPRGVFPLKISGKPLAERVLQSILGFFSVYMASFILMVLLLMATGLDQVSAFSAVATCMNNLGPGLGEVALSFASISTSGKAISIAAMLLGRLEVFSVLVLFHPGFWKS